MDEVRHEDDGRSGAFFIERDGARIAEMTYQHAGQHGGKSVAVFNHTEVDPNLRGRGIARKLMDAAVAWARQSGIRIRPTCSYVRAQYARDASIRDTLAE